MTALRSLCIALAMYSKLPTPQVDWDKRSLSWALCWFPLVGVVVGAGLAAWLLLSELLGLGPLLRAAIALLIPAVLSGGIHLDGFCDTCDALGSHQSRERKLEILKDTHAGAFAILCCILYLILYFAAWCEVDPSGGVLWILALSPVLSRGLSGLAAVSWKNARGTGLLATFTQPMDGTRAKMLLSLWIIATAVAMFWADPMIGCTALLAAALTFLYYRLLSQRQFGGITGDLAGFFLQLCECAVVLAVALVQKGAILI